MMLQRLSPPFAVSRTLPDKYGHPAQLLEPVQIRCKVPVFVQLVQDDKDSRPVSSRKRVPQLSASWQTARAMDSGCFSKV